MSYLLRKYLGSLVRHLISVLSGYLLSLGLAPDLVNNFSAQAELLLAALLTYAISQTWSIKEKNS